MSFIVAHFEVPTAVGRGIYVLSTAVPDTVELMLYPLPSGFRRIYLHRQTNARRLLARVGAVTHGASVPLFTLTCAIDPQRDPITFYADADVGGGVRWLKIMDNRQTDLAYHLLDRDRLRGMFVWLAGWINAGDPKHSVTRRGVYSSLDQERGEQQLRQEMREAQDRADNGE